MKKLLLFLAVTLSAATASAQIVHEVFGMTLGTEEQKVFESWNEQDVKYEKDAAFGDLYHIKSKNEKTKPTPQSIDVVFLNHRLFCARYTYPKDHFETVCELINMVYAKYLQHDNDNFRVYYDDKTKQFINVGIWEESTVLTYGIIPAPEGSPFGGFRRNQFNQGNQGQRPQGFQGAPGQQP